MKPVWIAGFLAVVLALSAIPALAQPVSRPSRASSRTSKARCTQRPDCRAVSHTLRRCEREAVVRAAEGRAEVLLTPGVVLPSAEQLFQNAHQPPHRHPARLLTGSAVVEADEIAKDTNVTLVCKDGTVSLDKKGLYRFDSARPAQGLRWPCLSANWPARTWWCGRQDVGLARDRIC